MDNYQESGSDDPRFTKLTEQVEATALKQGLFLDHMSVHPTNVPGKMMVMTTFRTGDVAYKNRRLDAAAGKEDRTFREMEDSFMEQQVEEIRRNLAEGRPFGKKDDE